MGPQKERVGRMNVTLREQKEERVREWRSRQCGKIKLKL